LQAQASAPAGLRARSAGGPETVSLISPEVLEDPAPQHPDRVARGIFSTAKLIYHAGKVLWRVISRFREGRDHGVYATVVEEVLRQLYFTNIGAALWGTMKRQTERTFVRQENSLPPGGWLLVEELGQLFQEGHRPAISVVGHS